MASYLGTLDLSWFPSPVRQSIARDVVPALLNKLGAEGIGVSCGHDLSIIGQVQAQHPRRPRLFELANPVYQPHASAADTFVLHLTRHGEDVAVAACRLRWIENNLAKALESQKLLFDSSEHSAGEFKVDCQRAKQIGDVHAGVTTGLTVLPGNPGVFKAMIRLLHLWTLANWQWGYLIALCSNDFAKEYPLDIEGYSGIHSGVMWKRDGIWTPYRLVIAERSHWRELVASPSFADLSAPLGQPSTLEA